VPEKKLKGKAEGEKRHKNFGTRAARRNSSVKGRIEAVRKAGGRERKQNDLCIQTGGESGEDTPDIRC